MFFAAAPASTERLVDLRGRRAGDVLFCFVFVLPADGRELMDSSSMLFGMRSLPCVSETNEDA
jgi:hypothetical protein